MIIDFFAARAKHREWKSKLSNYLSTGTGLSKGQVTSEKECDLGKWLYGDGMKKYGQLPEMQKLEQTHRNMHATVNKTISLKDAGDDAGAHRELGKVDQLSGEVINLLTAVENKISAAPAATK